MYNSGACPEFDSTCGKRVQNSADFYYRNVDMSEKNKFEAKSDEAFLADMKSELQQAFNRIIDDKDYYNDETIVKTICNTATSYALILEQERKLSRHKTL
jgi:hypothetical protein